MIGNALFSSASAAILFLVPTPQSWYHPQGFTYVPCEQVFQEFYKDYPSFWTGERLIKVDGVEEAARICHWMRKEYRR